MCQEGFTISIPLLQSTSASTQKFRYTESVDARAGQGAPTQAYWEYVEEAERSPA